MRTRQFLAAGALAGALLLSQGLNAEAALDAVSSASLTVGVRNVTSTTAVVEYTKDRYNYGTRTLCYDPAPAAPRNNCVTKQASGNQGSFNVTGLKPATTYNFRIEAIDTKDHERPYNSTGSFTTLAPTALTALPAAARDEGTGAAVDAAGRSLPAGNPSSLRAYTRGAPAR